MSPNGFRVIQAIVHPDHQGRITLSANARGKAYRISQNDQGQILLDPIPETSKTTDSEPIAQTQAEILADFRQGWHEAMTGQTIPLSQLWDGIDDV